MNPAQPSYAQFAHCIFLQDLSDPGAEDGLHKSAVLRSGVDLGRAAAPDETTILRLRRLDEKHELSGTILDTGTIVDATIISAPLSSKNSKGECDPEMHQTRKGNQWFFGAKAHIGVDSKGRHRAFGVYLSGFGIGGAHASDLLHAAEKKGWGDVVP